VKVYVRLSEDRYASANAAQAAEGGHTLATTKFLARAANGYEPDATYNGKEIMAPLTRLPGSKNPKNGILITIYSGSADRDKSLSNEAGDVMYYMEYNKQSLQEGSDGDGESYDQYRTSGSGKYSFDVEDTYSKRRKECRSNPDTPQVNPYPLKATQ
jgi:hypothetical protein